MADAEGLAAEVRRSCLIEKKLTLTHRDIAVQVVASAGVGLRLDRFLALALPTLSRSLIQRWLEQGYGAVDDRIVKPSHKVRLGDRIALRSPLPPNPAGKDFVPPPLTILLDTDGLLVCNKPPGQLAHQAGRVLTGTVLNQIQELLEARGKDPRQARLVNRIDRDTSGLIVCALDPETARRLSTALQAGEFRKEYLAICHGVPQPERGDWTQAIRDDPTGDSIARELHPTGQPSHTGYQVVERAGERHALLRLQLHTGRQHQIRVHAAGNGHPLVGDWTYGPACCELPGQALHAERLELPHPYRDETLTVVAPLHPRLQELWERLRAGGTVTPRAHDADELARLGRDHAESALRVVPGGWVLPSWLPRDDYERQAREHGEGTPSPSAPAATEADVDEDQ